MSGQSAGETDAVAVLQCTKSFGASRRDRMFALDNVTLLGAQGQLLAIIGVASWLTGRPNSARCPLPTCWRSSSRLPAARSPTRCNWPPLNSRLGGLSALSGATMSAVEVVQADEPDRRATSYVEEVLVAMTPRPRASLDRILADLGTTLLELVWGDAGRAGEIGGIVIADPVDEPVLPPRALVLGVGVQGTDQIVAMLRELGQSGAAALMVRAPVVATDEVTDAVEASGVALLGLTRGASWTHVAALLRSLLAEGDVGIAEPDSLGGMPSGDLFALANAIAALLDAPVTIEDRSSRVMAFSGRQDEADGSRIQTVLGRQVPEKYTRMLSERGVFRDLYRSGEPVYVDPIDVDADVGTGEFTLSRVAVGVRAGDELLGSIWAVVPHPPLTEERTIALRDSAKVVALHMLRIRAGADVGRRLRADLVSTVLGGGSSARDAAGRLGLADQPAVVVALSLLDSAEASFVADPTTTTERQRVADAFAMHLSAVHPRCAVALIGDVAYGIVPVPRDRGDAEQRITRVATDFLERTGDRVRASIGIGTIAVDPAELAASRASADRALRVLRSNGSVHRAAALADVYVDALLIELSDLIAARGDPPPGPIARLAAYDQVHRTCLVETLRAWLDSFGDVNSAARCVFVHPNTFRYRLRRVAKIGGIDLDDPRERFGVMLQLRVASLVGNAGLVDTDR